MSEQEHTSESAELYAQKMDDVCVWSSLPVYAVAWVGVLLLAVPDPWFYGPIVAAAYVGAHAYAIKARGLCFMFADSYAGPAAIAALVGTYLALPLLKVVRPPVEYVALGGAGAFFAGHAAVFLFTRVLKFAARRFQKSQPRTNDGANSPA